MKTTTLAFPTKQQLLEFYYTLGNVAFAVDLEKLVLTSALTSTDVLVAVLKFDAHMPVRKSAGFIMEERLN